METNQSTIHFRRVQQLCAEKGITVNKLEIELGIGVSALQKWRTIATPNASNLIKVAKYFNVSTDYILGETDIQTTLKDFAQDDDIISLQRARSKMSQKDKARMMEMLRIGFEYAFQDTDNAE